MIKPIYGLNDSPQCWFTKFATTVKEQGWVQSHLHHCVFFLWGPQDELLGVLGVHVDDVLLGGVGKTFEDSVAKLRDFPFRKWKIGSGTFFLWSRADSMPRDPETSEIAVSQQEFAEK